MKATQLTTRDCIEFAVAETAFSQGMLRRKIWDPAVRSRLICLDWGPAKSVMSMACHAMGLLEIHFVWWIVRGPCEFGVVYIGRR